jgi:2-dehydropantoate 2-reductase
MRIAVMGTGAVGAYFGAKLAAAGHELVFIARGQHLEAMRRAGLRIDSPQGNLHVRDALFCDKPAQAGAVELVLFSVKSYDTEAAAGALAPLIDDATLIVSLQNGVDNPEKLARLWGDRRIFAGVAYIGAQIIAPGVILHSAGGKIVFGQEPSANTAAAQLIERTLSGAGINCAISEEIQKVQWAKLLWNAPFCAISSLCRADVKQILESEALKKLAIDCMGEVQAAARTHNIELPDALFEETLAFSTGLGSFKPSMLQDLLARKPLEYEAFNGIVVRLLHGNGKSAPVNQCFYALLQQLDQTLREEAAHPV